MNSNESMMVLLKHIDEKIDRLVWRADKAEETACGIAQRVTILETRMDNSLSNKFTDKALWLIVGAFFTGIAKQLGWV